MTGDRHAVKAIPFRPESEDDRHWLKQTAADAGVPVNAVLCRLVRDARERTATPAELADEAARSQRARDAAPTRLPSR